MFKEMKISSVNKIDLRFYQEENEWRLKSVPIEVSKNVSDRVFDSLITKNLFILKKKLFVFKCKHDSKNICRWCLSSYLIQNGSTKHKQRRKLEKITDLKQLMNLIHFGKNVSIRI